jgi:hypothetical protein
MLKKMWNKIKGVLTFLVCLLCSVLLLSGAYSLMFGNNYGFCFIASSLSILIVWAFITSEDV